MFASVGTITVQSPSSQLQRSDRHLQAIHSHTNPDRFLRSSSRLRSRSVCNSACESSRLDFHGRLLIVGLMSWVDSPSFAQCLGAMPFFCGKSSRLQCTLLLVHCHEDLLCPTKEEASERLGQESRHVFLHAMDGPESFLAVGTLLSNARLDAPAAGSRSSVKAALAVLADVLLLFFYQSLLQQRQEVSTTVFLSTFVLPAVWAHKSFSFPQELCSENEDIFLCLLQNVLHKFHSNPQIHCNQLRHGHEGVLSV